MLDVTFLRVREEAVPRLREWLRGLRARREELRESYAAEGCRHERFFLLRGSDGPILVLIAELEDGRRGRESFLRSRLPLSLEFKELIQEVRRDDLEAECLYDSATLLDAASSRPTGRSATRRRP